MKSTDVPVPPRESLSIDRQFLVLRDAFYGNLSEDCGRLDRLANEFAVACQRVDSTVDASTLKEEIRAIAHRIYGAAAIFGAAAVGTAADALERAVFDAIVANSTGIEASARIQRALGNLVDVLDRSKRSTASVS